MHFYWYIYCVCIVFYTVNWFGGMGIVFWVVYLMYFIHVSILCSLSLYLLSFYSIACYDVFNFPSGINKALYLSIYLKFINWPKQKKGRSLVKLSNPDLTANNVSLNRQLNTKPARKRWATVAIIGACRHEIMCCEAATLLERYATDNEGEKNDY